MIDTSTNHAGYAALQTFADFEEACALVDSLTNAKQTDFLIEECEQGWQVLHRPQPSFLDEIVEIKEYLPSSFTEIVDVLDWKPAIQLLRRYGGVRFHVPKGKLNSHAAFELTKTIGKEAALKFMKIYGGANVYIPKLQQIKDDARKKRILNDFYALIAAGKTKNAAAKQIAQKYSITNRWVYYLLQKEKEKSAITTPKS